MTQEERDLLIKLARAFIRGRDFVTAGDISAIKRLVALVESKRAHASGPRLEIPIRGIRHED